MKKAIFGLPRPPCAPLLGVIAQHCNPCVLLISHPGSQGEEREARKKPCGLRAEAAHSRDLLCAGKMVCAKKGERWGGRGGRVSDTEILCLLRLFVGRRGNASRPGKRTGEGDCAYMYTFLVTIFPFYGTEGLPPWQPSWNLNCTGDYL